MKYLALSLSFLSAMVVADDNKPSTERKMSSELVAQNDVHYDKKSANPTNKTVQEAEEEPFVIPLSCYNNGGYFGE